ncbi:MAG: hypothetical protein H6Q88_3417 [Anaeromyxobacteraceae bacterium]|nr:hypothetical protein [Anaeromyxobacteraceae bacterium]
MATGRKAGAMVLLGAAWCANLAFDGLAWISARLAPPHLLTSYMPEAIWVWLDAPAIVVMVALAGGIPRSLVVAWLLARLQGRAAESR